MQQCFMRHMSGHEIEDLNLIRKDGNLRDSYIVKHIRAVNLSRMSFLCHVSPTVQKLKIFQPSDIWTQIAMIQKLTFFIHLRFETICRYHSATIRKPDY